MVCLGVDNESALLEYFADLTEQYLGDLIEEVIEEYYSDKVDISAEYEDILEYIIDTLIDENLNGDYDPARFEKLLRTFLRHKNLARIVLSYLISKYIEENENFTYFDENI